MNLSLLPLLEPQLSFRRCPGMNWVSLELKMVSVQRVMQLTVFHFIFPCSSNSQNLLQESWGSQREKAPDWRAQPLARMWFGQSPCELLSGHLLDGDFKWRILNLQGGNSEKLMGAVDSGIGC